MILRLKIVKFSTKFGTLKINKRRKFGMLKINKRVNRVTTKVTSTQTTLFQNCLDERRRKNEEGDALPGKKK